MNPLRIRITNSPFARFCGGLALTLIGIGLVPIPLATTPGATRALLAGVCLALGAVATVRAAGSFATRHQSLISSCSSTTQGGSNVA